jgi:hypothetical protein
VPEARDLRLPPRRRAAVVEDDDRVPLLIAQIIITAAARSRAFTCGSVLADYTAK